MNKPTPKKQNKFVISLIGIHKADFLAELFKFAEPSSFFARNNPQYLPTISEEVARGIYLKFRGKIPTFAGKILQLDISGPDFDPWRYDSIYGLGKSRQIYRQFRRKTRQFPGDVLIKLTDRPESAKHDDCNRN